MPRKEGTTTRRNATRSSRATASRSSSTVGKRRSSTTRQSPAQGNGRTAERSSSRSSALMEPSAGTFHELLLSEIRKAYAIENQIVDALPKLIKAANSNDLKQALREHLNETKGQVERLNKIFRILGETPRESNCIAIEGILKECDNIVKEFKNSPTIDAAIICAAQQVEHHEIALYGTLRAWAKELSQDDVANLLDETLDEEANADKKLTKLAQGSLFTTGLNKMASEESSSLHGRRR